MIICSSGTAFAAFRLIQTESTPAVWKVVEPGDQLNATVALNPDGNLSPLGSEAIGIYEPASGEQ